MTDIWVCSSCHSINRQRNAKCYKCGTSQTQATGEGSTLRVESADGKSHIREFIDFCRTGAFCIT